MKKISFLVLIVLAVTTAVAPVQAGDKEWARFGKGVAILTGLSVLHQAMWVRPYVRVRYEYSHRAADCRHLRCTHQSHRQPVVRTVVIHKPAKEKNTSYTESSDTGSLTGSKKVKAKGALTGDSNAKRIDQATAVIFELSEGRRLYQPKVKGKKAQLQVWSEVEKRWVAIKEYPSLY